MNGFEAEQMTVIGQLLPLLVVTLVIGPWWIVAGLRVLRKPSRVYKRSVLNWAIRRASTHGPMARGNFRFWASMFFLAGVGADLLGTLAFVGITAALF
jgi:hypothetical protein